MVGLSATVGQAAPAAPATPSSPAPTTAADALTEMRKLYQRFATASEAFHEAETVLGRRTAQATAATARAKVARRAAAGYRDRIRALVKAESRSHPFETFGAMISSDSPGEFAAQASLIEVVATRRSAVLDEATRASAAAAKAETEARTAAEAAAKLTRELRAQRAGLSRQADRAAALYRRLSAQERAALAAAQTQRAAQERAALAAQAQRAAEERASRSSGRSAPAPDASPSASPTAAPSRSPAPPPRTVPASGRAGVAVAEARRQIGKPYVWGATGPSSFDCSGLTSWAWRAAGVTIPRTSRQQYAAGVKVSRSALQPGDLVYFGSPIYHVAIYVGNNTMISAPQPGDVVKYQSLNAFSDYAGATRPG